MPNKRKISGPNGAGSPISINSGVTSSQIPDGFIYTSMDEGELLDAGRSRDDRRGHAERTQHRTNKAIARRMLSQQPGQFQIDGNEENDGTAHQNAFTVELCLSL